MTKETIEKVVNSYFTNMTAMNAQGWLEIFAEDAVICDPVDKPPMNAKSDGEKLFALFSKFYDKLELTPNNIFIAGNGAAVKWKMQVVAKNGKEAVAEGISVFEINENGTIQKLSSYWDEAAMLAQIKG
ncbi:MAG: nuclear transport factor 2 family protein [Cyanobacteria bacterium P01_H01_bin.35]